VQGYTFLFQTICGNHSIVGVQDMNRIHARHVGSSVLDKLSAWLYQLDRFANADPNATATQIRHLMTQAPAYNPAESAAQNKLNAIGWLRKHGYTLDLATQTVDVAEQTATTYNPMSFWGLHQATTRISQQETHQNDRLFVDLLAAKLTNARQLVTA
jgi:hypothetical protein